MDDRHARDTVSSHCRTRRSYASTTVEWAPSQVPREDARGGAAGAPERQAKTTRIAPAIGAWQELPLWLPLLARFPSKAQAALADERAYWTHPVARRYDDASRRVVRDRFKQYRHPSGARSVIISKQSIPPVGDELRQPLLREMRSIQGWLTTAEADPVARARSLIVLRKLPPGEPA